MRLGNLAAGLAAGVLLAAGGGWIVAMILRQRLGLSL